MKRIPPSEKNRKELEELLENGTGGEKNNFINPTELFKRKAKEIEKDGKRLYDPIDHHWTVEGNKFVGKILADYILLNYFKKQNE
jgi:hypothetical protein